MKHLLGKIVAGGPYLFKELRVILSDKTPLMVAQPSSIKILPSIRCNAFCPMCSMGSANQKGEKPNPTELAATQVLEVLNSVKDLSGKGVVVSFAYGEPTIWKPLWDMLEHGRDLGFATSFTTNGYTMKMHRAEKVAQINPFNVGVSLESLRTEVNEIMRPLKGKGTQKTIYAIENLLSARDKYDSNMSINIKSVISGINYEYVHEIVEKYAARPGVMWTPQPYRGSDKSMWVHDIGKLTAVMEHLISLKKCGHNINASNENMHEFVTYFAKGMKDMDVELSKMDEDALKHNRCKIGYTSIFVSHDAKVRLCPYMHPVGEVGDGQTLKEMWYGKKAQDLRKKISNCCVDCELACTRKTSIRDKVVLFLRR